MGPHPARHEGAVKVSRRDRKAKLDKFTESLEFVYVAAADVAAVLRMGGVAKMACPECGLEVSAVPSTWAESRGMVGILVAHPYGQHHARGICPMGWLREETGNES